MATAPTYAAVAPYAGSGLVSTTANTAFRTPSTTGQVTLFTAGNKGAQITGIEMVQSATPSACFVNIWRKLHGATTWFLVVSMTVTATNTKKGARKIYTFANLKLNATETLTCTCTVATQHITINAYGGNF